MSGVDNVDKFVDIVLTGVDEGMGMRGLWITVFRLFTAQNAAKQRDCPIRGGSLFTGFQKVIHKLLTKCG